MHAVIILPGLGDEEELFRFATRNWDKFGLAVYICPFGWKDFSSPFETKLLKLLSLIDSLYSQGFEVSLIGTSAGGTAVLNAYLEKKDKIKRVVTICSPLKPCDGHILRSFKNLCKINHILGESIQRLNNKVNLLTHEDKKKIMTVSSHFDEIIPYDASTISGARFLTIPTVEHFFGIFSAFVFFSRPIIEFIKSVK